MSRNKSGITQPKPQKPLSSEAKYKLRLLKLYQKEINENKINQCSVCKWLNDDNCSGRMLPVQSDGSPCPYFTKITA
jgi:hypothetical protein